MIPLDSDLAFLFAPEKTVLQDFFRT
jgi:hypothetical protein